MDATATVAIRDGVKSAVEARAGAGTVASVTLQRGTFSDVKATVFFATGVSAADVAAYAAYFTATPLVIAVGGASMTSSAASSVAIAVVGPSLAPGGDGEDQYSSTWLMLGICLGICCCFGLVAGFGCWCNGGRRNLTERYGDESKHMSNDDVINALFPQISPGKQVVNPIFGQEDRPSIVALDVKPAIEESFGFPEGPSATDVDRHMRKLTAYYDKYAPGTKSQADLKPIAEHTAAEGTAWLNGPLETKYGCSFDDFREVAPEPAGFGDDAGGAGPAAGVSRHLNHIQQYYDKHAPNTKTAEELTQVAEHCDEAGTDWLDDPLRAKYSESLTEFLESIGEFSGFDDEAPAAAAPASNKLRRQGSAVYAIQSGSDVYLAQLQAYYSKHAPGEKSTAELKPMAEHCVTDGTGWIQAPLKNKYGQSLDEFLTTPESSGADHAAYVEPAAVPAGKAGSLEPDVRKHYQDLEAFYRKHAPGEKTFADLKPIAEHCASEGTGWIQTALKQKYGQSLDEFLSESGAGASDLNPAVGKYLAQLQTFYAKHAPGSKTDTELTAVAHHCVKVDSTTWLDTPLKSKYGESFSEFTGMEAESLETESFGGFEEDPVVQAKPLRRRGSAVYAIESGADTYLQQLRDYYTKHAPGEKSTADLKPVAEHCVSQGGSEWLDGPLTDKYGQSLAEFLAEQKSSGASGGAFVEPDFGPDGNESHLSPDVKQFYEQLVEFYDKHAPGQKTFADLKPMAEHCATNGTDWIQEPLKAKYGQSLDEFLATGVAGDGNSSGADAGDTGETPAVAKYQKQLMDFYAKHAPESKTADELLAVAGHCVAGKSHTWLDAPMEAKYGESFSAFLGGATSEVLQAEVSEEPPAPEAAFKLRRRGSAVYAIESGADTYLQQLRDYYTKHAPGEKSTADLKPVAEHCVSQGGSEWLDGPLADKYGQSLAEFLTEQKSSAANHTAFVEPETVVEGNESSLAPAVAEYYRQIKEFYDKHAPEQKTFADLEPMASHCDTSGGAAWIDAPLKQKYGESLSEFLDAAEFGDVAGNDGEVPLAAPPQTPLVVPAITFLAQLQAFYDKHTPGEKTSANLQPIADHCVANGTDWLNGPMLAKYGETFDAFVAKETATPDEEAAPQPAAIDEPGIQRIDDTASLPSDVRAFYDQISAYYAVHTPGEKTFAELKPMAEHCIAVNGTGWMDDALQAKYGESMVDFLGRGKEAADAEVQAAAEAAAAVEAAAAEVQAAAATTAEAQTAADTAAAAAAAAAAAEAQAATNAAAAAEAQAVADATAAVEAEDAAAIKDATASTEEFTYMAPAPTPIAVQLPEEDDGEELYGEASFAQPRWGAPQNESVTARPAGPEEPDDEQETYDTVADESEQELYVNDNADGAGLYEMALDHELAVGDRVTVSEYDCRGTIRAVLLQKTASVFKKVNVGIELDESAASQVDAQLVTKDHLGVHFFETVPGAGVLVAVNRVTVVPADEDPYKNMQAEADEGSYRNVEPDTEPDANPAAPAAEDPYSSMPSAAADNEGAYRNLGPDDEPDAVPAEEDPYAQMPPVQYDGPSGGGGGGGDDDSYRNVEPVDPVAAEPAIAALPVAALPVLPADGDAASRQMSLELVTQQFKLLEQTMAMLVQANMAAPPANGAPPPLVTPAAAPPAAASPAAAVEPAPGSDAAINIQKAQLLSTMMDDERRAREDRARADEPVPPVDESVAAVAEPTAPGRFPTRRSSIVRGQSLMDRVRAQAQADVDSDKMSLAEAKRVITSSLLDSHPDKIKAREVIADEIARLKNAKAM